LEKNVLPWEGGLMANTKGKADTKKARDEKYIEIQQANEKP